MTRGKQLGALGAALLLTLSLITPLCSAEETPIRVGYIDYVSFLEPQPDGTATGYMGDYLWEIARYTDLRYHYVSASWADCLKLLDQHKLDLVCMAKRTPEREARYDFSDQPVGLSQQVLYTRPDNDALYYEDFAALEGASVGFLQGSVNLRLFADYARRNHFSYQAREYPREADLETALHTGEVDAIAIEHLAYHDDLKLIGRYGSEPFYFITWKGNPLMEELNYALSEIGARDPSLAARLFETYYGDSGAETQPLYTREEAAYIRTAPVLTVGNLPDRFPVSHYNAKTGELTGINEDLLSLLAATSGLRFDLQPIPAEVRPVDALRAKQFDLIAGIVRTDKFVRDSTLLLTQPLLTSNLAVVAPRGSTYVPTAELDIGITTSFQAMQEYIQTQRPNYHIRLYPNLERCLHGVASGEVDIMMQNAYVMSYWLQNPRYENLEIVPTDFLREETAIAGLAETTDPLLISILDKTLRALSADEVDRIVNTHTISSPYVLTLPDAIYKYSPALVAIGTLLLVCLLLLLRMIAIRQRATLHLQEKNNQLAEAVLQAETANSAKSQFLARMSHEIRTPMNAIIGITTIARSHENEPEQIDAYLEKINGASLLLLGLINDVLDMSAIEQGKLKLANTPFNLKELLTGLSSMYYAQCKSKGLQFDVVLSRITDETLLGDSLRLNQILLNLLSNAVKFTAENGGVRLLVEETQREESRIFLRFTVEDNGEGMDEEMLSRLFRPFEQETATTAQKHGGSGLGLSIAKNLVEMMQGSIRVESQKGYGSQFSVTLPFQLAKAMPPVEENYFKKLRVLVVDDDKDTLDYTSAVLARIGVTHDSVASGEEAIERITRQHALGQGYDVCFVDLQMPRVNGIEVTRKIRELFDEDTVVIIISAYDLSEVETEARAAGANLFITKPLFQSTVFNALLALRRESYIQPSDRDERFDFSGHRVLLAEDNALNREIAVELLTMTGMEVDCAENGQEAVEVWNASAPGYFDAILMDIQMPLLDGYEATRAIRAGSHPSAKKIAIYAMTANAFTDDVADALAAGMDGHIAKPIDTKLLYGALETAFRKKDNA